jgi:hypothetical protein
LSVVKCMINGKRVASEQVALLILRHDGGVDGFESLIIDATRA